LKRSFVSFVLTVVLPAAAAMAGARSVGERAWQELTHDSHARVARMTLADARVPPEERLSTIGGLTGYRTALYRNGTRWTGAPTDFGPPTIPDGLTGRLGAVEAVPAGAGPTAGIWLGRDVPAGGAPALAALSAPGEPDEPLLEVPVLLAMALLLVFGTLTGWIQLVRRDRHRLTPALSGIVAPALVPTLATLVFFIHVDRTLQDRTEATLAQDLTRGLAVASALWEELEPGPVHDFTGFHATLVRDGRVEGSSLSGVLEALAALPSPPSSFTASGSVITPEGPSVYLSRRTESGSVLVLTTLRPEVQVAALRRTLFWMGLALSLWWTVVAVVAWLASRRRDRRAEATA